MDPRISAGRGKREGGLTNAGTTARQPRNNPGILYRKSRHAIISNTPQRLIGGVGSGQRGVLNDLAVVGWEFPLWASTYGDENEIVKLTGPPVLCDFSISVRGIPTLELGALLQVRNNFGQQSSLSTNYR
jgi:hypothetical protein